MSIHEGFCVGDRFYLCDNKILCEYDYEERMVFANMSYSSDSLAHIKRQVSDLQQPPEESGISQRGPPSHHMTPSNPQPQQPPPTQPQPPSAQPHMGGLNGVGFPSPLPSPLPNGPSTSSGLIPGTGVGVAPPPIMGDNNNIVKGINHPPLGTGPGINGATGDDASSGYGSPDSLTLEDR
ncbi:hypothetical protein Anas_08331 [Armadillidium nasatum]|uniref:LIM domain only protein 3 n=1 Tax=Armadillidium nasatum TaxID=96803 RepID=A0A5N5SZ36_9CRUS|nr:hypothetical protein Anas_08331 [Armadillidium nasatum]